jgi:hypothetical protein
MINARNKDLVVVSGMMNSQVPVLDVVNKSHLKLQVLSGCCIVIYQESTEVPVSPTGPVDWNVAVDFFTGETGLRSTVLSI